MIKTTHPKTKHPKLPKYSNKKLNIVLFVVLLGLLAAFTIDRLKMKDYRATTQIAINPASLSPTPSIALMRREKRNAAQPGRQTYNIMMAHNSPVLYKAIIDPELVKVGQTQKMTVFVKDDDSEIVSVVAEIESDTKTQKFDLELIEGTARDGQWSGNWIVNDTHEISYVTKFIAKNTKGEEGIARLGWTDPGCCPIAQSGCTLAGACTVTTGTVDGADNGGLTLNSGASVTVQANATLSYGTSFTLNAGATLSVAGDFSQGVICLADADGDRAATNNTEYFELAGCSSGRTRKFWVTGTTDCCDTDNRAFPGQTAYYSTVRGCGGGYDFDCNGSTVQQWTGINGSCTTQPYGGCIDNSNRWDFGVVPACGASDVFVNSCPSCNKATDTRAQACH